MNRIIRNNSIPLNIKTILKYTFGTIIAVVFVFYVYLQANTYLKGPSLVIDNPVDGTSTTTELIAITGNTSNVSFIEMNGNKIFASENGDFREELLLSSGYNIIEVKVTDRFNRTLSRRVHINYIADDNELELESISTLNSTSTDDNIEEETEE